MSQCSKEDGRSSSGSTHEAAAPKRTYDMMEGRVSRAISSAGIEGGCLASSLLQGARKARVLPQGPPHVLGYDNEPGELLCQQPLERRGRKFSPTLQMKKTEAGLF